MLNRLSKVLSSLKPLEKNHDSLGLSEARHVSEKRIILSGGRLN